ADGGILIVEEELVKPSGGASRVKLFPIPATRVAEAVGNRLFANLVVLGFFTAITGAASAEAMKKALPGLVPDRFLKANLQAFDKGYEHGIECAAKSSSSSGAVGQLQTNGASQ
ncbi:MAG: 2-oxoacid:acceptor oxidoreductase family protein, partial [Rhodomicrobium sp.]